MTEGLATKQEQRQSLDLTEESYNNLVRKWELKLKQQEAEMYLAQMYSKSMMIPKAFQGKEADCFVAIQMAKQTKLDIHYVMQNIYVVMGRPSWSSQAIIAMINASGLFSRLKWRKVGEGDNVVCIAYATDKEDGEVLEASYALKTAKAEGLFKKQGSKWLTMPELMLKYRSATLFGRLYCPDVLSGLHSVDEMAEVQPMKAEPLARTQEKIL